jgi:hypothetical protein
MSDTQVDEATLAAPGVETSCRIPGRPLIRSFSPQAGRRTGNRLRRTADSDSRRSSIHATRALSAPPRSERRKCHRKAACARRGPPSLRYGQAVIDVIQLLMRSTAGWSTTYEAMSGIRPYLPLLSSAGAFIRYTIMDLAGLPGASVIAPAMP